ncbi:MAG: hypothetical protein NC133_04670 [Prevotella sp.]|nr:hypothetical protein [Muribaculaceae bacterium]MCM1404758.1 hypothetical protein [Prevotella sp.]
MTAAQFFVDFRASSGYPIDWSLQYIADEYILKVDKTEYIDKRYGSRVCQMTAKNVGHHMISPDACNVCYVYTPRTKSYSIATGMPGCCKPYDARLLFVFIQ